MMNIGDRIKVLRLEHDLTMEMLVRDMNLKYPNLSLDKSLISRWESGINDPTLENAKYLSMYFNVSLDYLAGLTDIRTPTRLLKGGKT